MKKAAGAPALREEIEKLTTRLADARAEAAAAAERARPSRPRRSTAARELERGKAEAAAGRRAGARPGAPGGPGGRRAALGSLRHRRAPDDGPAPRREGPGRQGRGQAGRGAQEGRRPRAGPQGGQGRLETDRRVYMVQKGELDIAKDRHPELRRRNDALRKEHEELIDAVRQAAREEKRAQEGAAAASREAAAPARRPRPARARLAASRTSAARIAPSRSNPPRTATRAWRPSRSPRVRGRERRARSARAPGPRRPLTAAPPPGGVAQARADFPPHHPGQAALEQGAQHEQAKGQAPVGSARPFLGMSISKTANSSGPIPMPAMWDARATADERASHR